jgi:hypothetical protein
MSILRPGEHPDELLSASLTGDLSDAERALLDAHLASCPACRETLAAFAEQRRLISGMHHVQPPRDLAARVRTGIESGRLGAAPWWRRPGPLVGIFASAATVAAGVLAVVVFSNLRLPETGQTGSPHATATASTPAAPTASLEVTPLPSVEPTPPPVAAEPEPVGALVYTVDVEAPDARLELVTNTETQEIPVKTFGTPTDATLSPDHDWVAFKLFGEGSGLIDAYAYRISDGTLVRLTEQGQDSPFLRFAWSPDGRVLAYSVLGQDAAADVWLFYPATGETRQLTRSGAAFAASFFGGTETDAWLWVSVAGQQPTTYRLAVPLDAPPSEPVDPAASSLQDSPGAFLPVTNGSAEVPAAAVWRGEMASDADGWHFAFGGMLYMSFPNAEGEFDSLGAGGDQVFSTLSVQPNGAAFASARFDWAPDGDGFAVWGTQWTGPVGPDGFPDPRRVYFAHLSGGSQLISAAQALDAADTQGATQVVDVALGGGQYLALTLRTDAFQGNEFAPEANLVLITRRTGTTPDEVRIYRSQGVWNGPALYPTRVEATP